MKHRNRADWERLVSEQESSGKSQAKFCAEHGISVASLGYWRKKLKEESFIELPAVLLEPESSGKVVIELPGGAVLRFSW